MLQTRAVSCADKTCDLLMRYCIRGEPFLGTLLFEDQSRWYQMVLHHPPCAVQVSLMGTDGFVQRGATLHLPAGSACVMKYKWRYYDDSVSIPSYCGLAPDFWISKGNLPLIPSILKEGYMYIHNWLFLRILLATAAKVPPFFMFIWYLGKCITLITKPAKNHHRSKQLTPRTTESLR